MHKNNPGGSLRLVTRQRAPQHLRPVAPPAGTDAYHERITDYARRIRGSRDVDEIIGILDEALRETRALNALDELTHWRKQVAVAENRITTLKDELEAVRGMLREDVLTGALNRRGLDECFVREAARADRNRGVLSVALLDLDNFKRLNDTHGHHVGDHALTKFAAVARKTLRPNDVLSRHGGEEFVILFPDTRLEPALATVARLQSMLAAAPLACENASVPLTFSAGVAVRQHAETLEMLLRQADGALYQAKRAGKNRVYGAA